jgi:hypothetical protein
MFQHNIKFELFIVGIGSQDNFYAMFLQFTNQSLLPKTAARSIARLIVGGNETRTFNPRTLNLSKDKRPSFDSTQPSDILHKQPVEAF